MTIMLIYFYDTSFYSNRLLPIFFSHRPLCLSLTFIINIYATCYHELNSKARLDDNLVVTIYKSTDRAGKRRHASLSQRPRQAVP